MMQSHFKMKRQLFRAAFSRSLVMKMLIYLKEFGLCKSVMEYRLTSF